MDLSRMSRGGGDFQLAPAGSHGAVCIQVVDLGQQATPFVDDKTGQPKKADQIRLTWEIDERMEDGRRFVISKTYTASMHEKANLRKDLEAWRGVPFKESDFQQGGFSLRKLLGAPCLIQVAHYEGKDGKQRAKVAALMKLPKGTAALKPEIEPLLLDLAPDAFDRDCYDALPEFLREIIAKSPQFQALPKPGANGHAKSAHDQAWEPGELDVDDGDGIPF